MASLIKLLKEDRRRKKLTSDKAKLEDTLRDIIENPAKFAMASSLTDDRTWLHFAAQQASVEATDALIESGADVNARDLIERTPLHHACFTSTKEGGECVRLLLQAGSEPNAVDCMSYTPLHFACQMENYHAINQLAKSKTDMNAKGPSETSILCVDALLRAGASVHVYDEANRSPADVARERGAYKALKALHDAAAKRGRVKYLYRDEAQNVGATLARTGTDLRSAIPQMMMAIASGLDPKTGEHWAEKPEYSNEEEEAKKAALEAAAAKLPGSKHWNRAGKRTRGKIVEGKFYEAMLTALPGPKEKFDLAAQDAERARVEAEEEEAIAKAENEAAADPGQWGGTADESYYDGAGAGYADGYADGSGYDATGYYDGTEYEGAGEYGAGEYGAGGGEDEYKTGT